MPLCCYFLSIPGHRNPAWPPALSLPLRSSHKPDLRLPQRALYAVIETITRLASNTALMLRFFALPFTDAFTALERGVGRHGAPALVAIAAACLASWWVYVPIHELMHAWGAQLGGATVTRLDIAEGYGGSFLQRFFPYVHVGSEYAGQLTGFDTHGSDAAYLLTVFFPYLLTIAVGIPIVIYVARAPVVSVGALLLFGAALPVAWAPLLSVTGDFYELGSILTSRIAHSVLGVDGTSWRGDDLVRIARPIIDSAQLRGADVAGVTVSFMLGVLLAFATCGIGRMLAIATHIRAGEARSRPR